MNIRQIEAFRAVMETGSVTRAAEQMHISQPAVSKLIRSFSDRCGFRLFTRSGGRLVATAEARLVAVEVERLFMSTERIGRVAEAVRNRELGQLTVAALPALAIRFLPRVLSPFLALRPDLHFSLHSPTSRRVCEMVAGQQVDLGLSLLPVDHPYVSSEVITRFAFVCALPAGHPLSERSVVTAKDLRDEPFISLWREDRSSFVVDQAFESYVPRRRTQIEAQLAETACAFVAGGLGVSIVPPFAGGDYPADSLEIRPFTPAVTMDVWLLTPTSRKPSLIAVEVIAFIRDALAAFDVRGRDDSAAA